MVSIGLYEGQDFTDGPFHETLSHQSKGATVRIQRLERFFHEQVLVPFQF